MIVALLSGPPRGGKTGRAVEIARRARAAGRRVAGFVAHGSFRDGVRSGFDLELLDEGRRVPLSRATAVPPGPVEVERSADGSERVGRFLLSAAGLEAGRRALADVAGADLVIVDEVGWLELEGGGCDRALAALLEEEPAALIVLVVRQELVERVRARYGLGDAVVLGSDDPGAAARLERLWEDRP